MNAFIARTLYEVPTQSFRFFNVFGPRQHASNPYSGVIAKLIDLFFHNKNVTIYGDGSQTRDFIYISDIVRVLADSIDTPTLIGGTFNLCSGKETSIKNLYTILTEITGKKLV